MASYPGVSDPYKNTSSSQDQGFSSYDPGSGVLTSGSRSYSVAPDKASSMLKQVEAKKKKKNKNKSGSTASPYVSPDPYKEAQGQSQALQTPKEIKQAVNSSPGNKSPAITSEQNKNSLREAYLRSQAGQRARDPSETLAPTPKVDQSAIRIGIDTREYKTYTGEYLEGQDQRTRNLNEARQSFREKFLTQTNVAPEGFKGVKSAAKLGGTILGLGAVSLAVGGAKGVKNAVRDVVTGQIITNTGEMLTEIATNPRGVAQQLKADFNKNPFSFTGEQLTYAYTTKTLIKSIKTGEITEIVKPINVKGAYTKKGSLAESGQRLYYNAFKSKDLVGSLIVAGANKINAFNQDLGKRGSARLSKAEIRFKSRTGFTKAQIRKGEKPSQSGTTTRTFYQQDLQRNQGLQSRVANFPYPEDINTNKYKKFSLVKNQETKKDLALTTQYQRGGTGTSGADVYKVPEQKQGSSQTTTKNVVSYGKSGDLYSLQTGKVKVTYQYPKKPTLNPKKPEPKKSTPFNKQIELLTNVNEKGQEIFTPASNPAPILVIKGFRNSKTYNDLYEKVQKAREKREVQLKNIETEKILEEQKKNIPLRTNIKDLERINQQPNKITNTQSAEQKITGEVFKEIGKVSENNPFKKLNRKQPLGNTFYSGQDYNQQPSKPINYAPRVSEEQLGRTKTFTKNVPSTAPRVSEEQLGRTKTFTENVPSTAPKIETNIKYTQSTSQVSDVIYKYGNAFANIQVNSQLQSPSIILGQSNQYTGQFTQVIGEKINTKEDQLPEIKPVFINPIPPEPKPIPPEPKPRGGNRPRPPTPIEPEPKPEDKTPIISPPVDYSRRFIPIISNPKPTRKIVIPVIKVKTSSPTTKIKGFDVLVRSRGNFKRVNTGALSRVEALNLGAFRVGTSASATFKIIPSKLEKSQSFTGRGVLADFYSKGDLFIEKRSRRIKSQGELQEITYKGLQSQKFKKIF